MAKGGEEMQFEEIYARYYKEVYYYLLSLDGNRETAEELTQETFYRALKGIRKFKGESSLKTWLCQIAKNTYLSYVDKQKVYAENEVSQDILTSDQMSKSMEHENAEAIYIKKEQKLSIYRLLHSLEEPYKEVFTLRAIGDLSFKEIGEIFDRKEGWARVTYHRAKLKIRELMKEGS